MWHFTAAAPADGSESEITTFMPETTSTYLPETTIVYTTTSLYDARQNEVDSKFTTLSDIDEKIESIEADLGGRSTESPESSTTEENVVQPENLPSTDNVLLMAELNESTTMEVEKSTNLATEETSNVEETTDFKEIAQQPEDVEEIQEPMNNKKLESIFTNESTGENFTTTQSTRPPSMTTLKAPPLLDAGADNKTTAASDLTSRTKALQQIKRMLKAYTLRTLLTMLNDARKRQQSPTEEQHAMESQVVEESIYTVSGSECECEQDDEVSTDDDDDKVITFDKDAQQYVYTDREKHERVGSRQSHVISKL